MVIYKYTVPQSEYLELPAGAKILHVGAQGDDICLWAEVDPGDPILVGRETRKVVVVPTGGATPEGKYVGTVNFGNYTFVFHVFDCGVV